MIRDHFVIRGEQLQKLYIFVIITVEKLEGFSIRILSFLQSSFKFMGGWSLGFR